jgi:hypothetical protein
MSTLGSVSLLLCTWPFLFRLLPLVLHFLHSSSNLHLSSRANHTAQQLPYLYTQSLSLQTQAIHSPIRANLYSLFPFTSAALDIVR